MTTTYETTERYETFGYTQHIEPTLDNAISMCNESLGVAQSQQSDYYGRFYDLLHVLEAIAERNAASTYTTCSPACDAGQPGPF